MQCKFALTMKQNICSHIEKAKKSVSVPTCGADVQLHIQASVLIVSQCVSRLPKQSEPG